MCRMEELRSFRLQSVRLRVESIRLIGLLTVVLKSGLKSLRVLRKSLCKTVNVQSESKPVDSIRTWWGEFN